jgi:O-antigen/teichoic acid export membrane protein
VLANLLLAVGLQRALLRATVGSAVVMILLGVALTPTWGAAGAAVAAMTAMAAGQAALAAARGTGASVRPVLAAALRPAAVAGVCVAVGLAFGGRVGAVAALVLVYPLALFASGTVTRSDVARWRAGEARS